VEISGSLRSVSNCSIVLVNPTLEEREGKEVEIPASIRSRHQFLLTFLQSCGCFLMYCRLVGVFFYVMVNYNNIF
jgi:hypothetical protein